MAKKVCISADTTCDMPKELQEKYAVSLIPPYITFGDTSYLDGIEMTPDELYKRYETEGVLPKTSAISIGDFVDYFTGLLETYDQVIHFSLSSGLSCTYQNAVLAAEEFEGRVFILDTLNLSTAQSLMVIHAAELLAEGKTAEEIVEEMPSYIKRVDASFIIESLEFLHKGGRCSTLAALGANLLSIKPCIEVQEGKMDVGKKYRGKFKQVLQKYVEEKLASGDFDTTRIFVTHAGCDEEVVEMVCKQVKETGIFEELLLARAGCTISSHCGRNTLGILFVHKA
ncbi:MAG: DegV family protein [Ruminococcaceae bacterium]|nr:DegV family protein [Oscillospiraceae bacterium]